MLDFLFHSLITKIYALKAFYHAHSGHFSEAFDAAFIPLELARRHPASRFITHLVALNGISLSSRALLRLSQQCKDATILQGYLARLKEIDPLINLHVLDDPFFVDTIGDLRVYGRAGHKVDLAATKPRSYFFHQQMKGLMGPDKSDPMSLMLHIPTLSRPILELLYSVSFQAREEAKVRENIPKVEIDLVRFHLAAKAIEINTGKWPATFNQLQITDFPNDLKDPFSNENYLWNAETRNLYGVGPDCNDDHAEVNYDPTNGILSSGDIFFTR